MPQSHRAASPGSLVSRHDAGSGGGQPGGHGGGYAGGYAGYGGVGENTAGSGGHGGYSEEGGYHSGRWHHGGGPGQYGQHGQHGQRSLLQKPQGSALSQLQGRVRRLQGGEKSLKCIVNILSFTQLTLL